MCLLSVLCLANSACSSMHMANDAWTGQDKAKHFAVSAALGAMASHAAAQQTHHSSKQAAIGIGLTLSIGAGKELHDGRRGGSGFSWRDMAYNTAGALVGYQLYRLSQ